MQETVKTQEFIEKHKSNANDFTRKRNLSFEEIMIFVTGNLGTSLDFEVLNFMSGRTQTVTPSAISQARDKIKSSAFEEIFKKTSLEIPVSHTYQGYRLTCYDGIKGELPRTPELMKMDGKPEQDTYPQFHAVAEYDLLNCCYTNAIFQVGAANERNCAIKLLEQHDYAGDEIFLLDRGFPSVAVIQQLEKSKKNYVMRISKNFLKEINDFRKSRSTDEIIQIHRDKPQRETNHLKGVELPYSFQVRCVKIKLPSGETEILATNLSKSDFSFKSISELYDLRWKIETGFLHMKYAICIEDFMGVKENSIRQEFFASLFKANLFMQFVNVADDIIYNKKKQLKSMNTKPT